ncbi:Protein WHAT'S THIS FACTOR 1 [Glycine soja]
MTQLSTSTTPFSSSLSLPSKTALPGIPMGPFLSLQCQRGDRDRCAHEGCNIYEAISIFEEFTGPKYNLPWFRLTPEAAEIDRDEKRVYEECREDLRSRLRKMILMTREHVLPLKIIQGMQWYLGLLSDFLQHPEQNLDESFRFVDMEDGLKGLALDSGEKIYSLMEKNATKRDKRLVGVLHELLSLFVEHSAERKKLFCLKKYFGLPQKVHRAFERHPHMFYISFRNKTRTVILKEAYSNKSAIEKHPLLRVRKKYIKLMKKSEVVLRNRRVNNRFSNCNAKLDIDSNDLGEKGHEMSSCSLEQVA